MSSTLPIQFTGNIDITDAIREFTHNKFEHLGHHTKNILNIHIAFDVNKQRHKVTARIKLAHKGVITTSQETDDLYASIEATAHNVKDQLNKIHDKQTEHR